MTTLPLRAGPRPRTTTQIPHSQLDQQPGDRSRLDDLLAVAGAWPGVSETPSEISVAGARALVLGSQAPVGPPEAFLAGYEFCHGHAGGDFSLHACLPPALAAQTERMGWGEPHFLVRTGQLPPTVVMLYAPRDEIESQVVLDLLHESDQFAHTSSPAPEKRPA